MNPVHQRAWWGGAVYDNERDSMAWESFETLEVSLQGFAMKKVMYRWSKCQKMFFKNWNRAAVSDFMQVLVECCSVVAALSCQMSLQLYTLTDGTIDFLCDWSFSLLELRVSSHIRPPSAETRKKEKHVKPLLVFG